MDGSPRTLPAGADGGAAGDAQAQTDETPGDGSVVQAPRHVDVGPTLSPVATTRRTPTGSPLQNPQTARASAGDNGLATAAGENTAYGRQLPPGAEDYVRALAGHGVPVDEIAAASHLPLDIVERITEARRG